jgi:lambda family phage portal protein
MGLWGSLRSVFSLSPESQAIADTVSLRPRAMLSSGYSATRNAASKHKPIRAARDLKLNTRDVRLAARVAYFDSLLLRAVVERLSDCVVGDGLQLEATPNAEILGLSPDRLEKWSRNIETKFDYYASDKDNHVEKSLTFYQLQRLCSTSQHRDGEYFVRVYYEPDGVRFGMIDPDQIVPGRERDKPHYGVIVDEYGAPTGYNLKKEDNSGKTEIIPAKTSNGKPIILHGFLPVFAGQTRGLSRLAHVLEEANILTEYELAELHAAVQQSQLSFYVKPSDDAPSSGGGFDTPAFWHGDGQQNMASTETDTEMPEYQELAESVSRQPGAIGVLNLGAGESLEPFRKTSPSLVYPAFFESIAQYVSASLGVPLSIVKMLFQDSYSASRGELQMFWRIVAFWISELSSDYLNPFYSVWLEDQIARGAIRCPGFSDPRLRKAWLSCGWAGASIPQLDPNKQASADKAFIEMGATTLKRVAREYNQSDALSNRAALRREIPDLTPVPWSKANGF